MAKRFVISGLDGCPASDQELENCSRKMVFLEMNMNQSTAYKGGETVGQDPEWGDHIWKQPLWVVPFDLRFE